MIIGDYVFERTQPSKEAALLELNGLKLSGRGTQKSFSNLRMIYSNSLSFYS